MGGFVENNKTPIMFIGLTKKELHHVLSVVRDTLEDGKDPENELDILQEAYHKISDAFYSFDDK